MLYAESDDLPRPRLARHFKTDLLDRIAGLSFVRRREAGAFIKRMQVFYG
jgi:hypothetical protein